MKTVKTLKKKIEEDTKHKKRHNMFMDWKKQYCQNATLPKPSMSLSQYK
jgi:hypothetical protein